MNTNLVSVDWLNEYLNNEHLIVLDASPTANAAGLEASTASRMIPTARPFNIKGTFSDQESSFPNTIPSEKQFENECRKLGINNSSTIVVYDNLGIYTSPRVWWMFNIMGHQNISVLNGGLPEWISRKYKTINKKDQKEIYASGNFSARFQHDFVKTYQDILKNIDTNSFLLVDARSKGRFNGTAKEPRQYLKSGHIPNSINIPFQEVLEDGKFKTVEQIKKVFDTSCNTSQDLVFSCGSGITACIIMLAYELAFKENRYLFDGSWTEWAERQNLKIS